MSLLSNRVERREPGASRYRRHVAARRGAVRPSGHSDDEALDVELLDELDDDSFVEVDDEPFDDPDDSVDPFDELEPPELALDEPRLSVLKNPEPLNVTPTG